MPPGICPEAVMDDDRFLAYGRFVAIGIGFYEIFTIGVVASPAVVQIGTFGIAIISCTVTSITAGVDAFAVLSAYICEVGGQQHGFLFVGQTRLSEGGDEAVDSG